MRTSKCFIVGNNSEYVFDEYVEGGEVEALVWSGIESGKLVLQRPVQPERKVNGVTTNVNLFCFNVSARVHTSRKRAVGSID